MSQSSPRTLLIATHNAGKVAEYTRLLADLPLRVTALDAIGITNDVEETGSTFAENAILKAVTYAQQSGLWAWADDSGLEVDALNGQPGIYSARFAGPTATDEDNNRKLLTALRHHPAPEQTARFRCVVAIATPAGDVHTVEAHIDGLIIDAPRGTNGFGYDPLFYIPERGVTMAELPLDEKNRISHRGQAARKAKMLLLSLLANESAQIP